MDLSYFTSNNQPEYTSQLSTMMDPIYTDFYQIPQLRHLPSISPQEQQQQPFVLPRLYVNPKQFSNGDQLSPTSPGASFDHLYPCQFLPRVSSGSSISSQESMISPRRLPSLQQCINNYSPQKIEETRFMSAVKNEPIAHSAYLPPLPLLFSSRQSELLELKELNKTKGSDRSAPYNPRGAACVMDMCKNKAVSRGKCISHGGGCRCKFDGCTNGAKMHGLCHLHGGKRRCKEDGCARGAKLKGLCWAHGGNRVCRMKLCTRVGSGENGCCRFHCGEPIEL